MRAWLSPRRRGIAGVNVVQALRTRALVADSVGLSSADRQRNIAGRVRAVRPVAGEVLVVDDIVTTGATACESVRVLQTAGATRGGRSGGRQRLTPQEVTAPAITRTSRSYEELKTGLRI